MISDFWRLCLIAVTILGLDSIWLTINRSVYMETFARIQGSPVTFNLIGAAIAYSALILGAYITTGLGLQIQIPFLSNLMKKAANARILATMLLFAVAYLVWNGTMLAVFKDYSPQIAIMDILWGIALGGIVGYVTQVV
jgi:uncharacterized membrane protein